MLYCKACQSEVPAGEARCYICRNGFVAPLACRTCNGDVSRGSNCCPRCDVQPRPGSGVSSPPPPPAPMEYFPGGTSPHQQPSYPPHHQHRPTPIPAGAMVPAHVGVSISITHPPGPDSLPAIPHLPRGMALPTRVPEGYLQQSFGAKSEITMNGDDAAILTDLGNLAALLHAMAGRMNGLQGHMASTRQLMRQFRVLSADIQEEIEVRLGPQGPLKAG